MCYLLYFYLFIYSLFIIYYNFISQIQWTIVACSILTPLVLMDIALSHLQDTVVRPSKKKGDSIVRNSSSRTPWLSTLGQGYQPPGENVTLCTRCPKEEYNSNYGSGNCTTCPAGYEPNVVRFFFVTWIVHLDGKRIFFLLCRQDLVANDVTLERSAMLI